MRRGLTTPINIYLNKDNVEYGAVFGANLLNIFQAGNINDVNKINEKLIEEQRLAVSMTVLSQVHIANINYAQTLREYSNAKHYLNVAQRINDLISNAQKISRFGELELIREEASLLVSRLRNDIAYAEMQYSLGTLYSSVGMNFTPDNLSEISDADLAIALRENLNQWTKKYNSFVAIPLNDQNPVLVQTAKIAEDNINLSNYNFVDFIFKFDEKSFYLEGSGKTRYSVKMANGDILPSWLIFLPSQYTFVGNPPVSAGSLDLTIEASNDITNISDTFTLNWDVNDQNPKSIPEEKIIETETVNEEQLNALNQALEEKLEEIINTEEVVNEELLDSLIAALNFKEKENLEEAIDVIFDSSFKVKSKPKPNQQVVISALTDSLTGQIESMTSYDPNQSAFIQVGAFKKENVSEIVAADISKKLGARVEVRPTLVSDPVMYRILVGPEHKDQIINVIADLMDLGISDYFLTRG